MAGPPNSSWEDAHVRELCVLVLCGFFAGGCGKPTEGMETSRIQSSIVGGSIETGYRGVVFVRTPDGNCSGTLVDPSVVITAKHCVYEEYSDGTYSTDPYSGSDITVSVTSPRARRAPMSSMSNCRQRHGRERSRSCNEGLPMPASVARLARDIRAWLKKVLPVCATPLPSTCNHCDNCAKFVAMRQGSLVAARRCV